MVKDLRMFCSGIRYVNLKLVIIITFLMVYLQKTCHIRVRPKIGYVLDGIDVGLNEGFEGELRP